MKENKRSRYSTAKKILVFWTLFIGLGAIAGSLMMLIDPTGKSTGMSAMLPYFKNLPFADVIFTNFIFSGIALLIVNGITNLVAAGLLIADKKIGIKLGGVFGVTLMLWICIQFYMFPFNFMSTIYFIFGFLQAITGYAAWVFYKQETFTVNESDYRNIGTVGNNLVVYFSRMGYVKKIAYEKANEIGADIYEIKSTERTSGTLGFWWCGRFGMHRWGMPIENCHIDFSEYEKIVICSPIWVFALSSPVREFCKQSSGKIKSVEYILVHHTAGNYENAAKEMDALLKIKGNSLTSVQCKKGVYKSIKRVF